MIKIKATRNVMIDGKPCEPGDVVETDERTAKYLVAIKKATFVGKPPAKRGRTARSKKADGAETRTE